ncbi:hypothetical protein [Chitinophaga nivalis]|uniref:Uncharacterized protein n=1 Tax=Chitinophaga nivalis TaxID=2991709 RepID=A0ABT3IMY0_9BACT|nr:hypothetical protein [Chitinophaga nivalis]MCW3464980.1 hypothetical protein [Chitinophaga nivalis]MCW3485328.1 hypothetical protein [Chitinophaga nivalis]
MKKLLLLILAGSLTFVHQSCQKSNLTDQPIEATTNTVSAKVSTKAAGACFSAPYVDTWHYPTPQLYITHGNQYARYDVLTNTYKGVNSLAAGYAGVPFSSFDAAYVDTWHYATPQLYIFSGNQYARYDIQTNTFKGVNTIAAGYAGVPFSSIDAAYVDTWHYPTPQLYLFSGTQYARYDILTNTFKGVNSISAGYAGVPFSTFDGTYVDTWHYPTPQLYIFRGNSYARYDILTNTFKGVNSTANGYAGIPFCQ